MDKAEKVFMKLAKEDKELSFSKLLMRQPLGFVPAIGNYLTAPKEIRKKHVPTALLLGQSGALGAHSKDTGKSYLGRAMAVPATFGAGIGAAVGVGMGEALVHGAKRYARETEQILGTSPEIIKNLKKDIMIARATGPVTALATGAIAGLGGAATYGLAKLFSKKHTEKK